MTDQEKIITKLAKIKAHAESSGADMVLCQVCGGDYDSGKVKMVWRPDITGHPNAGNVCPSCLKGYNALDRLTPEDQKNFRQALRRTTGALGDEFVGSDSEVLQLALDADRIRTFAKPTEEEYQRWMAAVRATSWAQVLVWYKRRG